MGNEMSVRAFVKHQHVSGNLEGHTFVQGCAYAQESLKKILKYHLWLILRLLQWESEG